MFLFAAIFTQRILNPVFHIQISFRHQINGCVGVSVRSLKNNNTKYMYNPIMAYSFFGNENSDC